MSVAPSPVRPSKTRVGRIRTLSRRRPTRTSATPTAGSVLHAMEGLEVRVRNRLRVSEQDIDARIETMRRNSATVSTRGQGEPIAWGDEVLVDAVGYVGGKVFSSRRSAWLEVRPSPLLPGLFEALVGQRTGTSTVVPLRLPRDYPDPAFASERAAYAITVHEAREVNKPSASELFQQMGLGNDASTARAKVRSYLEEIAATALAQEAKRAVLRAVERALGDKAPVTVAPGAVDVQMASAWEQGPARDLRQAGVPLAEQQRVREAFTQDLVRRAECRRALWAEALLDHLADALNIEVPAQKARELVLQLAGAVGLEPSVVDDLLASQSDRMRSLRDAYRRDQAFDALLRRVSVIYV